MQPRMASLENSCRATFERTLPARFFPDLKYFSTRLASGLISRKPPPSAEKQ